MKPPLFTILLCLLLGALANVAVAWWCAGWSNTPGGSRFIASPPQGDQWPCEVPADWPARAEFGRAEKGVVQTVVMRWTYGTPPQLDASVDSRLYGWPLRSLSVHTLYRQSARSAVQAVPSTWREQCALCGAALVDSSKCAPPCNAVNVLRIGAQQRPIPVGVIWPGFAVNTLFYAVVLGLLICGPFALRRFIRRKRGRCPACGYPAGESAVRSECGKQLPKRLRPAT